MSFASMLMSEVTPLSKYVPESKPRPKPVEKKEPNRTEKSDACYINAIKSGAVTNQQIADFTGKRLCTVQCQLRKMEKRGLVVESHRMPNKANPPITWKLK